MTDLNQAFDFWKKAPTQDNAARLVEAASPVLDRAMTTYAGQGNPILKARAKSLAMKAFKTYDPRKGTKLRTHLMIQLQPLRRAAVHSTQLLHAPERMVYDRQAIDQATKDFSRTYQREPSDAELADKTGLSAQRIRRVRQRMLPVATTGQFGEEVDVPVSAIKPSDIWLEYVYHELQPADKNILDWRLGRHGRERLSNNDIAKRLGLSPAAVSQRTARIIARLQEGEGLDI